MSKSSLDDQILRRLDCLTASSCELAVQQQQQNKTVKTSEVLC